jgi:hypothetical protein
MSSLSAIMALVAAVCFFGLAVCHTYEAVQRAKQARDAAVQTEQHVRKQ